MTWREGVSEEVKTCLCAWCHWESPTEMCVYLDSYHDTGPIIWTRLLDTNDCRIHHLTMTLPMFVYSKGGLMCGWGFVKHTAVTLGHFSLSLLLFQASKVVPFTWTPRHLVFKWWHDVRNGPLLIVRDQIKWHTILNGLNANLIGIYFTIMLIGYCYSYTEYVEKNDSAPLDAAQLHSIANWRSGNCEPGSQWRQINFCHGPHSSYRFAWRARVTETIYRSREKWFIQLLHKLRNA